MFNPDGSIIEVGSIDKYRLEISGHATWGLSIEIFKSVSFNGENLTYRFAGDSTEWKKINYDVFVTENEYGEWAILRAIEHENLEDVLELAKSEEVINEICANGSSHHRKEYLSDLEALIRILI